MAHWIRTHLDVSATDYQAVIPVPLHDTKQRERGFNQAAQLAGMISHQTGIPQIINLLRRIRPTDSQTHLTRSKRQANMKNAFAAAFSPVEFISVLLVDDVLTTGATASECAKTLKRCGISKVNVLTLARGMPAYF